MSILDTISQRLNGMQAIIDAADRKVGLERDERETQSASLASRTLTLENDRDSMGAELVLINSKLNALSARLDVLIAQLEALS